MYILGGDHIHDDLQMRTFVLINDCIRVLQLYLLKFCHLILPPACKWTDFMEWCSDGLFWAKWASCSYITWIGRKVSYTSRKTESQCVVHSFHCVVHSFTSDCPASGPVLEESSSLAIGKTRQSGHVRSWHFGKRPSVEFSFVNLPFAWRTYTQDSLPQLLLLLLVAHLFCYRL